MKRKKLAKLINKRKYKRCAEIGVFKGSFSKYLIKKCPEISLLCVDAWSGVGMSEWTLRHFDAEKEYNDLRKFFKENYPGRVTLIRKKSKEASLDISEGYLDFVYIDASHDYESVIEDLEAWTPKVRIGGVVSGHDYSNARNKKVKRAVDAFFKGKIINLTTEHCKSWWVTK